MRKTYGPGYPRTLGALMAWSELDPEAPAVTDAAGTLDRRAFQNRVLRFAAGLRRGGVSSGSRVALWLPNGSGYLAAIFACARLGALAIHINTRFRTAEVGNLLRRSRAVVLVTQWGFPPVDFPAIVVALPVEDRAGLRCVLGLQLPPGAERADVALALRVPTKSASDGHAHHGRYQGHTPRGASSTRCCHDD
jgi:fatty-acyl-CoA synthase